MGDPLRMMQIGVALVLAAFSLWLMMALRRPAPPRWLALRGLGAISRVSLTVMGLSGLLIAYHLFVYAAKLTQFRAPLWAVLAAGLASVGLSLTIDAMEHHADRCGDENDADDHSSGA